MNAFSKPLCKFECPTPYSHYSDRCPTFKAYHARMNHVNFKRKCLICLNKNCRYNHEWSYTECCYCRRAKEFMKLQPDNVPHNRALCRLKLLGWTFCTPDHLLPIGWRRNPPVQPNLARPAPPPPTRPTVLPLHPSWAPFIQKASQEANVPIHSDQNGWKKAKVIHFDGNNAMVARAPGKTIFEASHELLKITNYDQAINFMKNFAIRNFSAKIHHDLANAQNHKKFLVSKKEHEIIDLTQEPDEIIPLSSNPSYVFAKIYGPNDKLPEMPAFDIYIEPLHKKDIEKALAEKPTSRKRKATSIAEKPKKAKK